MKVIVKKRCKMPKIALTFWLMVQREHKEGECNMYYIFYKDKPYGTHIKRIAVAKERLNTLSSCLQNLQIRKLGKTK